MKISAIRSLIKEAISDMELSLKLSNGKIIHGLARKNPKALSLQIGSNTYFSFWEGKFILSGTGSVTIVEGVDDYSQEWFLKATEEYLEAMHDAYPERFGPLKEGTSRDAFMAGWSQSKANLGKGKIKGDIRDIDAWMEYSQGEGSEEDKDAFIQGWFKAKTTTDLDDVDLNEGMFDMFKSKPKPAPKPLSDFQKEIAKKYFEDRNKKLPVSWTSSDGTVYSGNITDIDPFEIDKSTGDRIPKVDATVKIMSSPIKGISIPLSVMTKDNTTIPWALLK